MRGVADKAPPNRAPREFGAVVQAPRERTTQAIDTNLPCSIRRHALDGKGRAVHRDRAVEWNLLDDQPFGETAVLRVCNEMGQLVRRCVGVQLEMGVHRLPLVEHRPLQDRASEKLPEPHADLRVTHFELHHVRVPRNLGE